MIRSNFNLHRSETVSFSVDQTHHLVSFIRKISPSPDWFVGIDSLDLCRHDCKWKDNLTLNLTLLDAGTDDGITYTSPNHPTQPQKTVRKVVSLFSSNSSSPFYIDEIRKSILPFAQITFKMITTTACAKSIGVKGILIYPQLITFGLDKL